MAEFAPQPQSFRELVVLFEVRREGRLYALLYQSARLVRFEIGQLEVSSDTPLPVSFAGEVGKKLSEWTGQRWLVSLSREQGEEPLHVTDKALQLAREQAALQHPVVKAVMDAFPGTKMIGLKQKIMEVPPTPAAEAVLDSARPDDHSLSSDHDFAEGETP